MTQRLHFHFSLSCIGEGNGSPLQCSCLENSRDGGAWWAAVYGVPQSQTRLKPLSSSSSIHVCTSEATLVLLPAALASRGAAVLQSPWPAPTDDAGPQLCCATALQGTPLPPRRLSDSRAGGRLPGAGLESRRTSHTHTDYHTVLQKASLIYLYQLHIGSAYQTCLSSLKTL